MGISVLDPPPLAQMRRAYELALLERSAERASRAVSLALDEGAHPLQIYDQVIVPAQLAIGERWHDGEISISEEHIATQLAIDQLNRLRQLIEPKPALNRKVVIGALSGDAHWLGARIVADHFFYDGWEVDFLGASPPTADLVGYLNKTRPDLLLLSITLGEDLHAVAKIVDKLGEMETSPKLIVGGRAFQDAKGLPKPLEDVHVVSDPRHATTLGRKLCGVLESEEAIEQLLHSVGQKLQARRKARGLSQKEVADAAGIDRTYLSSIESGKQNATLSVLARLAFQLDLKLHELVQIDQRT